MRVSDSDSISFDHVELQIIDNAITIDDAINVGKALKLSRNVSSDR